MKKKIIRKAEPKKVNNLVLRQVARDTIHAYLTGEVWEVTGADIALRVLLTVPTVDE